MVVSEVSAMKLYCTPFGRVWPLKR
jgi:hypothetical protein